MASSSRVVTCLLIIYAFLTDVRCEPADQVPKFVAEPKPETVAAGGSHSLMCLVEPATLDISWMRNGQVVVSEAGVVAKGGVLTLNNVTQALVGDYECMASTDYGRFVSSAARIEIAEMESFGADSTTVVVNVTEGNTALITCTPPASVPAAVVTYELNGVPIDLTPGRHMVLPSGNLHIGSVRHTDQGTYRCIATNTVLNAKVASASVTQLNVLVPVARVASRMLARPAEKMTVLCGEKLILECLSQGSPVPVINWDKYEGYLPEKRVEFKLGNLIIHKVEPSDAGQYICRGSNDMGPDNTAIIDVEVLEKPVLEMVGRSQTVNKGSILTIKCEARGSSQVHVHWLHNGVKVTSGAGTTVDDRMLTIDAVRPNHGGLYQCVGTNSVGASYAVGRVDVVPSGGLPSTTARPSKKNSKQN